MKLDPIAAYLCGIIKHNSIKSKLIEVYGWNMWIIPFSKLMDIK